MVVSAIVRPNPPKYTAIRPRGVAKSEVLIPRGRDEGYAKQVMPPHLRAHGQRVRGRVITCRRVLSTGPATTRTQPTPAALVAGSRTLSRVGDAMKRAPVPFGQALLSADLLWRVALMTPAIALATFGWFVWRHADGMPYEMVRTETFTLLTACCWFNVLNCQSATHSALRLGILRNHWLQGGLSVSIVLQCAVLCWPPMNALFFTVPIPPADPLPIVAVASPVLWVEELRKLVARLRRSRAA